MKFAVVGLVVVAAACGGGSSRASERAAALAAAEAERERERAAVLAQNEADRLAALWNYAEVPVGRQHQRSASIKSSNNVETGGAEAKAVLLVFRDHPQWGRSSYLVLESGEFNCPRCSVAVVVDGAPPVKLPAHRARSDEAIALFIDDAKALWTLTDTARQIRIEFPVRGKGVLSATYDVAGLDATRLPGWP
jgi:hypothetical protein